MHVLPRWPDPGTRVTASPDQRDCQASRERRSHIPPSDQSRHNLFGPDENTYLQPVLLPLCIQISLSSALYYQMCIHVWMWHVTEYACVRHIHVYSACTWMRRCAQMFGVPVCFLLCWYKLVTAFAWTSLVVSTFFFLPWTQETRIQLYDSPISISSSIHSSNHIWF